MKTFLSLSKISFPLTSFKWAILLTSVLCTAEIIAQSPIFTFVAPYGDMDSDQNKVISYATNLPHEGSIHYINWDLENLIDDNWSITIVIPTENGGLPISFELLDVLFENTTDYAVYGKSNFGDIAIYTTEQGRVGTIDLVASSYSLYPLGDAKGLLVKNSTIAAENASCATDTGPEISSYCEGDCNKSVMDVLAMVTPSAAQWLDDTYGIFSDLFLYMHTQNINAALLNSGVGLKRVRIRIIDYVPDFNLSMLIVEDLQKLSNSANALQALQQNGADIGILLTNQTYLTPAGNPIFGRSNSTSPNTNNKFCIAQVPYIGPSTYTFAHELAHQIGCLHDFPINEGEGCRHGKRMLNGKNTIMTVLLNINETRIPYFSNPDIPFADEPTGTPDIRNNAAQIKGAFCQVADINTPVWFSVNYEHDIVAYFDCPFSASANIEPGLQAVSPTYTIDCPGPYNYEWSWAPNITSTFNSIGTNSPYLDLSAPPNCPIFYLRLTVTSSTGCISTYQKIFQCKYGLCERSGQKLGNPTTLKNHQILPNPAFDKVKVMLNDFSIVKNVAATNMQGTTITNLKLVAFENGELTCDVSKLSAGLWFLSIQGVDKNLVLKLAIIR